MPSLCTRSAQTCRCNRVARTWASVPCSTQEPMPTMTATFVAARSRQRPNISRAQQAFTHTRILGEHTANIKRLYSCDFLRLERRRRDQEGGGTQHEEHRGVGRAAGANHACGLFIGEHHAAAGDLREHERCGNGTPAATAGRRRAWGTKATGIPRRARAGPGSIWRA